jgi:hypothetical protein
MIEQALLDRLQTVVSALALTPAPALVGVIEPHATTDLPALVMSIEASERLGNGLGERSMLVTDGALAWQAEINLANPVLATDPSFSLINASRTRLTLPHGGLVRHDATTGALTAADIHVEVNDAARTLVPGAPGAGQFSAEPLSGTLLFGDALPMTGTVDANYFLGQWEQRVVRSHGVVRLAVLATTPGDVRDLSNKLLAALGDPEPALLPGLSQLSVTDIGSIGAADPPLDAARRRVLRFRYEFEQEINAPASSGGIIQRIPIQADLE